MPSQKQTHVAEFLEYQKPSRRSVLSTPKKDAIHLRQELKCDTKESRQPHLHRNRTYLLLKWYPEARALIGNSPSTALAIIAVTVLQVGIALVVAPLSWWVIAIAAYVVGALVALALWTLLHECSHDLVFRTSNANRWLGIITGLPLILPAASSFRTCHLLHHRYQGDPVLDGDIASEWEIRLVGNSPFRKALWLFSGALMQGLRPSRMRGIVLFDRWFAANLMLQLAFSIILVAVAGWGSLIYCLLSNVFALGLHPLGARWIQEHFVLTPGQETYSYYGPLNHVVFNAGYHVEHHDLMRVPWHRLPKVRQIAPELYEGLQSYTSWTKLLVRFLFDKGIRLDRRAIRQVVT